MIKRLVDILAASLGLLLMSPVLVPVMFLVWINDFHSPFYVASRIGRGGKIFKMVKLRSMVVNADKSGVDSTSSDDNRITAVGHFIRRYKLDEFTQLWNVLCGQMSLVGPRPNVQRDVDLYSEEERNLLNTKPGITDFSSIVFSDEGEILSGHEDPDLLYNQIIRPWKSRLGLFYIKNQSFMLDMKLIYLTVVAILSREKALNGVYKILKKLRIDEKILKVSQRKEKLYPFPPPGLTEVVAAR